MRKLLFIMHFTRTRKERLVNAIIGIIPVISLLVGFYLLYGKVSPWYFLPFAVAFLFENIYYTEDDDVKDMDELIKEMDDEN